MTSQKYIAASLGTEMDDKDNPLLAAEGLSSIPMWLSDRKALALALANSPVSYAGGTLNNQETRALATDEYSKIFVPTIQSLKIAAAMLRVIYQEFQRRNPRYAQTQMLLNSASMLTRQDHERPPWSPIQAKGMVLEGVTGIGKSHIIKRIQHLLPQVVTHEADGSWGVFRLKQLVWLTVPMPADHTRKGLLASILAEMDRVMGTEYVPNLIRSSSRIEYLIVHVMQALIQHRCGMLVIEEAQESNLGSKIFSSDFLNFFLRLLNYGVPIMIVGNPLAFRELHTHAQVEDRFSEGGWFTMTPEIGPETPQWQKAWIPGLWEPSLLDEPDAPFEPIPELPNVDDWPSFLWQLTGGIPRQLARLRTTVMEEAMMFGVKQVTSTFVYQVFTTSAKFSQVQLRNQAMAEHDPKVLFKYRDIPLDDLRKPWGLLDLKSSVGRQTSDADDVSKEKTQARQKDLFGHIKEETEKTGELRRNKKGAKKRNDESP